MAVTRAGDRVAWWLKERKQKAPESDPGPVTSWFGWPRASCLIFLCLHFLVFVHLFLFQGSADSISRGCCKNLNLDHTKGLLAHRERYSRANK